MKLGIWFQTGKRDNGESYVTLKDGRPDWLYEAVYDAHNDMLPDDWVYAECEAACEAIDEGNLKTDDDVHEYADGRVDIYTRDRFKWAADKCLSSLYAEAEEQARDCGSDGADTADHLGAIQYHAIYAIASTMLSAVTDAGDESEVA